jgi:hypothetical protein
MKLTEDTKHAFWRLVVQKGTTACWSWAGEYDADCRPLFRSEKAYRVMYEEVKGDIPAGFHVHHKCESCACVNPGHLVALSPEAHRAVHATKDKTLKAQIYRGEWEQIEEAKAEAERFLRERIERQRREQEEEERRRLEAVRLEQERLERERLKRQRHQERLEEIEREIIAARNAEDRRITKLRREQRVAALQKFCIRGVPGIVFGLLVILEIKFQWFPTIDHFVLSALVILAMLAFSLSLIAIERQLSSPIPGAKVPRWQLDEVLKHRRLRRKTDPDKIVWTRTFEGVAVTEFPNHWARVAAGLNGFDFFIYAKDSGRIAYSWYNYATEQGAMHAAVDFMRGGIAPSLDGQRTGS